MLFAEFGLVLADLSNGNRVDAVRTTAAFTHFQVGVETRIGLLETVHGFDGLVVEFRVGLINAQQFDRLQKGTGFSIPLFRDRNLHSLGRQHRCIRRR